MAENGGQRLDVSKEQIVAGRSWSPKMSDVLYIHPPGHLNDLVIPAGAISCMNAVNSASKLGRYAFEVSDEEIQNAKVVAVDLHWGISAPAFLRVTRYVRTKNPRAKIIVGGITAGHLAQELVEKGICDFVVQGDSEVAFSLLVSCCLENRPALGIPNVVQKGAMNPVLARMTQAQFDATDTLTTDWFPTYERLSDLETKAFAVGKTIMVARGCPLRCTTCYGSVAQVFGRGVLVRSPESLVAMVKKAHAKKVENLRLIVGKPSQKVLNSLLKALHDAGPFDFATSVGFYLCSPLTDETLFLLDRTFKNPVVISVVPPEEHEPALSPNKLALEMNAWKRICKVVSKTRWLTIDMWANQRDNFERLKGELGSKRVKVSLAAVWQLPRPGAGIPVSFDFLKETYENLWTYFVARLVSPTLARLLAPFGFLDELMTDPSEALQGQTGALAKIANQALWSFATVSVPMFCGFGIGLVSLSSVGKGHSESCGIKCSGNVKIFRLGEGMVGKYKECDVHRMKQSETYSDILWEVRITVEDGQMALGFVPLFDFLPPTWLLDERDLVSTDGVLALELDPSLQGKTLIVKMFYRLHSLWIFAQGVDGRVVAKGKADLQYFTRRKHLSYSRPEADWQDERFTLES